ncbi:PKD domain-containing protein [Polluticoccus soli]|uniref:PKD domain-containing protein n=1 Tax=Polluticoccus soli TaxID=3034150 RepID=UPI0023E1B56B|nr:PKD domain-containing protein [Flavipsychrobacter sp. JY13-12]
MRNLLLTSLLCASAAAANAQCSLTANFTGTTGSQPTTVIITNSTTVINAPSNSMRVDFLRFSNGSTAYVGSSGAIVVNAPLCGSQSATLIAKLVDSSTQQVLCIDSITKTITANCPPCYSTFTKVNGANGLVTFTANNLANTPGITYTWVFGDGTSATGSPVSHVYPTNGSFIVKLISSASSVPCIDSTTSSVYITNKVGCQSTISKTYYANGIVTFSATTSGGNAGKTYTWQFGDGSSGTGNPITHQYVANGTYSVTLSTTSSSCFDSTNTTAVITNKQTPSNWITGMIIGDSTASDTFKVWLIQFDSTTNNLYAVDSQVVANGFTSYAQYNFINKPNGAYRVKAHQLDGPTSGTGYLPTYHLNSLYWNTASVIYHMGGATAGKNILMQTGTVTSGPGFVGGNVTLGANKGTSNGIAGQLIFVRDNNDQVIAMTYTDNNGDYLFQNLPLGTYSIYPEDGGYTTTPASITLTNLMKGTQNIHFEKHEVAHTITPKPTSVSQVTENRSFKIYPNPTNGFLYIDLATRVKASVSISDVTGKRVYKQELSGNGSQQTIDINHLRAGQYIITVEAAGKHYTQKFVLEK